MRSMHSALTIFFGRRSGRQPACKVDYRQLDDPLEGGRVGRLHRVGRRAYGAGALERGCIGLGSKKDNGQRPLGQQLAGQLNATVPHCPS